MDNLDNTAAPTPATQDKVTDLQQQLASLRQLVGSVLVVVFILAGSLNIYFLRQLKAVNSELKPLKNQSAQITAEVAKINSAASEFARRLLEFSKAHPDFAPILHKYNIREVPATNAPVAAPLTAPAKQ
jgi:cell division protein FtsB